MGYTKIVRYGDIIEVYEYEKELKKKPADSFKAHRIYSGGRDSETTSLQSVKKKRKKAIRDLSLAQGVYERSKRSIRRSRVNFFRLCHHNNSRAKTIHFLTLTFAYDLTPKKATRIVHDAMARIARSRGEITRYISVPELTKKGRIHFHLLVYDLPPETSKEERASRNFQRQFRAGYVDLRVAKYNSEGIAGYMAKYMAKALGNSKLATKRGYTCSRGIDKISIASGNTIAEYLDEIVFHSLDIAEEKKSEYDVPYLGRCRLSVIKKKA